MSWRLRSLAAGALDLPPAEHKTLIVLADFARDDGLCWPSRRTVEQLTGLSESSVKRAMRALVTRGLVIDTGRRRMAAAERQIDLAMLRQADRFEAWHASPEGAASDPFGGSPMTPGGAAHDPFGGSPMTPGGASHDPPKGSPMTRKGVTHDPQPPLDPHQDPHQELPPTPGADPEPRGEGGSAELDELIGRLASRAVAGWAPTRGDRTVLAALVRDVGAPGLLRLAEQMPGYRTHPVSALVSLVERPRATSSPAAELSVGGASAESSPMPDRAEACAALADQLAQQYEAGGWPSVSTTRDAALAWEPVRDALAAYVAPTTFEAAIAPLTHLLTASTASGMDIHLDADPFVVDSLRARYPDGELDALASSINPPRPRRICLHSAGLEGQAS